MDIEAMKVRIAALELLTHALLNAAAANSDSAGRFVSALDESLERLLDGPPGVWDGLSREQLEDVAQSAYLSSRFIRDVPR